MQKIRRFPFPEKAADCFILSVLLFSYETAVFLSFLYSAKLRYLAFTVSVTYFVSPFPTTLILHVPTFLA